jgi:hypothetical protein
MPNFERPFCPPTLATYFKLMFSSTPKITLFEHEIGDMHQQHHAKRLPMQELGSYIWHTCP